VKLNSSSLILRQGDIVAKRQHTNNVKEMGKIEKVANE